MIKTYKINLNDNPKNRWKEAIADNKKHILAVHKQISSLVDNSVLGKVVKYMVNWTVDNYVKSGKIMYYEELNSIATQLNLPVNEIILLQLAYEIMSACTSGMSYHGNGKNTF